MNSKLTAAAGILKEPEALSKLPILDHERVASIRVLEKKSSPGLFADLVETFREESAQALASLEQCSQARDFDGLRKCAHVLASMSAGVGVARLCRAAQDIEKCVASDERFPPGPALEQLRMERERAVSALCTALEAHP